MCIYPGTRPASGENEIWQRALRERCVGKEEIQETFYRSRALLPIQSPINVLFTQCGAYSQKFYESGNSQIHTLKMF